MYSEEYRRMTRAQILEVESEADAEAADRVRGAVAAFINHAAPGIAKFLITLRKDGRPHCRPVSAFTEHWIVSTISQGEHLKNQHIRNNPQVGYLWVEQHPEQDTWPKCVWMQGTCEVIEDKAVVDAFFAHRQALTGQGNHHPNEDWSRLLLRTTPTLVRAEGFLGPNKPALYRDFSR